MTTFARLLLLVLLALSSCSRTSNLTGGGNDFPNSNTTTAALGTEIAGKLAKGDHWSDSITTFTGSTSITIDSSYYVPKIAVATLSKKLANSTSTRFDYSDTASLGIVRLYYDITDNIVSKNDTIIFLYDSAFHTSAPHVYLYKGKVVTLSSGSEKTYLYRDDDGDSVINNRNGRVNRLYSVVSTISSGITKKTEVIIDGGADGNLDTRSDNRVLMMKKIKIDRNNDTLSSSEYLSYSGDSAIIDPARGTSFKVRIHAASTDSLKKRISSEAVFMLFPSDSTKNYPLYIRNSTVLKNGGILTSIIHRSQSDSLLNGRDTAAAEIILDAPSDTVLKDTLHMSVLPGASIAGQTGYSLVSLHTHILKTRNEREKIFSLIPDAPSVYGKKPAAGAFTLRLEYASGEWITIKGNFNVSSITGDFEDSQGNKKQLTWDRSGKPVN